MPTKFIYTVAYAHDITCTCTGCKPKTNTNSLNTFSNQFGIAGIFCSPIAATGFPTFGNQAGSFGPGRVYSVLCYDCGRALCNDSASAR